MVELGEASGIEDVLVPAADLQPELLVKVAVEDGPRVVDTHRVPAHQALPALGIEACHQEVHVILLLRDVLS